MINDDTTDEIRHFICLRNTHNASKKANIVVIAVQIMLVALLLFSTCKLSTPRDISLLLLLFSGIFVIEKMLNLLKKEYQNDVKRWQDIIGRYPDVNIWIENYENAVKSEELKNLDNTMSVIAARFGTTETAAKKS